MLFKTLLRLKQFLIYSFYYHTPSNKCPYVTTFRNMFVGDLLKVSTGRPVEIALIRRTR